MAYKPEWLSEDAAALLDRLGSAAPGALHAEVIVVGSGYGGAVAAARFARALHDPAQGSSPVWVLERGREHVPGTFPNRFADLPGCVRLSRPDEAAVKGRADGLFDFRLGADVSALVGCGLGGGSLINAAVAERPHADVFDDPAWPAALRRDPVALDRAYARAEAMLGARTADPAGLAKYEALRGFASTLGAQARPVRLAIRRDDGASAAGVAQRACIRCGDCVAGCNHWAKNSLPMNYLAEARRWGASLYCNATVDHVRKAADGNRQPFWEVAFRLTMQPHPPQSGLHVLRARHVVLAGGSFGSTEVLMRSREKGLRVSPRLGERFSTNGDMISVHYGYPGPVNAAPEETSDPAARNVGPTITGLFECGAGRAGRVAIEELAIPGPLRRVFEEIVTTGALPVQLGRADWSTHLPDGVDPAAVDPARVARSQVFAAMGDDGSGGRFELVDGWAAAGPDGAIRVAWKGAGKAATFARQDAVLARSERLGGAYLRNPLWKPLPEPLASLLSGEKPEGKLFTVHPLGGCPMGDDPDAGVVDDLGRVFDPTVAADRAAAHAGLLVLDGAILPVAPGINPLLTIAALAERAAEGYARLQGWDIERTGAAAALPPPPLVVPPQPRPARTAVRFAERMTGRLALGGGEPLEAALEVTFSDIADIAGFLRSGPHPVKIAQAALAVAGAGAGGIAGLPARLEGTVYWMERGRSSVLARVLRSMIAWLRTRFLADLFQRAREVGWLRALAAGSRVLGILKLASNIGETRHLRYEMKLIDDLALGGRVLLRAGTRLHGLKTFRYVRDGNPWRQLSELTVSVRAQGGALNRAGILEVDPLHLVRRFAAQFQVARQLDQPSAILDIASIGLFMARNVLKLHFWSFRAPEYEKFDAQQARRRLPGPLPGLGFEQREVAVRRGGSGPVVLPVTRYWHCAKPAGQPVLLIHGFGASGAQFAHPAMERNFVRHLAEQGFDVWVAELRTSIALPSSLNQWTLDEVACEDIPAIARAVLDAVKDAGGNHPQLDVLAHCIGSAMFCTAVLAGRLQGLVRRAVLLQVGPLITLSTGNRFRGYLAAAMRRYMLTDHVDSSVDDRADAFNTLLDRLLATYPYPDSEVPYHRLEPACEAHTHLANCNRSAAVFGRLFQHANVEPHMLDALGDLLGHTNLRTFEQTVQYAFMGRLTDYDACNSFVTDHNVARYFSFPVRFLHGERNDVFHPDTTWRSRRLLKEIFGWGHPAQRIVLRGYGHLDPLIGRDVERKVFRAASRFLARPGLKPSAPRAPSSEPRFALPPLIGPVLGWLRRDHDAWTARVWCRTDDEQSFGAFLIALVLDGRGRPVPGHVFRLLLRSGSEDVAGRLDLHGVADIPLPGAADDYEILIATAHSGAEGAFPRSEREAREQRAAQRRGGGAAAAVASESSQLHPSSADQGADWEKASGSPPGVLEPLPPAYAASILAARSDWSAAGRAGESARYPGDPGYEARVDAVRVSQRLQAGLAAQDRVGFVLGSCRYGASLVDRVQADAMFGVLRARLEAEDAPSLLLLAGDQIYADATAGLFDPKSRRARFHDAYREAWTAPNAREVLRRIPTYMMMDDHEVSDDWHPGDPADPALPRAREWGLEAFADYQWALSPRNADALCAAAGTAPEPASPFYYAFAAAGFPFFVCDTRSGRLGRNRVLDLAQQAALARWLADHRAEDGRPLFVVSPSVVLPRARQRYADGWSGFGGALAELFGAVADAGARNVVFLSGDPHFAMTGRFELRGAGAPALEGLCVVGSPMYAPFPFANAVPGDFDDDARLALGGRRTLHYRRDPASVALGDSFTQLGVARAGREWEVTVEVHGRDATLARTSYRLPG
jgi:choline dehydrogenase-like flavoprotein